MLKTAVRYKKMPLFYGYIIAFMARQLWGILLAFIRFNYFQHIFLLGLQDCDHPDPNVPKLCIKGSAFLRAQKWDVVNKYRFFAKESANIIGRDAEIV